MGATSRAEFGQIRERLQCTYVHGGVGEVEDAVTKKTPQFGQRLRRLVLGKMKQTFGTQFQSVGKEMVERACQFWNLLNEGRL